MMETMTNYRELRGALMKNAGSGKTQYEYMEILQRRMTGQARMFLDYYLEKWDWRNDNNPNLAAAALREVDRAA